MRHKTSQQARKTGPREVSQDIRKVPKMGGSEKCMSFIRWM